MESVVRLFAAAAILSCSTLIADNFNGPTELSLKVFDDLTIKGPANLNLIKAKTLNVKGPLDFSRLKVAGYAGITGPVKGAKGEFGTLDVTGPLSGEFIITDTLNVKGPVDVSHARVSGETTVEGPLTAADSTLNNVTVFSDKVKLENVTLENILIKHTSDEKAQTVILGGQTVINGNITFESGQGKLIVNGETVEIKGSVKGATKEKASQL